MKNYEMIIDMLADKINEQNTTIALMKWQIDDLKKRLETAEYHLNPTPEKAAKLKSDKGV